MKANVSRTRIRFEPNRKTEPSLRKRKYVVITYVDIVPVSVKAIASDV